MKLTIRTLLNTYNTIQGNTNRIVFYRLAKGQLCYYQKCEEKHRLRCKRFHLQHKLNNVFDTRAQYNICLMFPDVI